MSHSLYIVHALSCFFMTGLIWVIQLIHYPSFAFIHPAKFKEFHHFHSTLITRIVGPVMLLELASGLFIFFDQKSNFLSFANFMGLLIIWLATAFLSVPAHSKLSQRYDEGTVNFLVKTNWVRTLLWTLRSGLIAYFILNLRHLNGGQL